VTTLEAAPLPQTRPDGAQAPTKDSGTQALAAGYRVQHNLSRGQGLYP
jgi:hypothetical protein